MTTFSKPLAPTILLATGAILISLGSAPATAALANLSSGTYESDPTHSYITFTYDHLGLSNPRLAFDDFSVRLDFEAGDPTNSRITVTIEPESIVAGSSLWKDHLMGAEFFDVENHPTILFASDSITEAGDGAYKVDGELTIKDVVRPVTLDVTINDAEMAHPLSGDPVIGVTGSTTVLRSEFGMGDFAPMVSDEVMITFTSEMLGGEDTKPMADD